MSCYGNFWTGWCAEAGSIDSLKGVPLLLGVYVVHSLCSPPNPLPYPNRRRLGKLCHGISDPTGVIVG